METLLDTGTGEAFGVGSGGGMDRRSRSSVRSPLSPPKAALVVVVEVGRSRLREVRSCDSRSATDGPGVLECEELPEFEDGIIEEVVDEDEDGLVFPGPRPGLGPGPDELELEAGAPSSPLECERDESETWTL